MSIEIKDDRDYGFIAGAKWAKGSDGLKEVLESCLEYFDNKADADWEGEPGDYVPNKEMQLLSSIREVLKK